MPGGAVNVDGPAAVLSEAEVKEVLERHGVEVGAGHVGGNGGLSTVAGIALFASLGGLLFGLDIGYIAGIKAMATFERDILGGQAITPSQDSEITMIFGCGAAIAAFPPIISALVDRLGRKGSVVVGGIVFCIGALAQGLAGSLAVFMIGRLVAGMSVGVLSANVPVYQGEIAPQSHRGMLVSVYQLAITIGIMAAFVLALALENVSDPVPGWRWVILVQLVPGAALALGGLMMGESPRWLVSKGKHERALKVLRMMRSAEDDVQMELAQIATGDERDKKTGDPTWREFFSGFMLKLLCIGVLLQLVQQMCGLNAFMYDGPVIFEKMYHSKEAGLVFTSVSGAVNIISTFPAIALVDKSGRTTLLRWSAIGMAICSGVLGAVGSACFSEHKCHRHSGEEDCHQENGGDCGDWAKWTATGAICLFIFNFGYGWGPVVWTYCAEMFPMKYRTKAIGLTTDANWVGNIFIAFLPPILLGTIGFNTFFLFCGINVVGAAAVAYLPETKDRSLEEIQEMFRKQLGGDGASTDGLESSDKKCGSEV